AAAEGTREKRLDAFRRARDEIIKRIDRFAESRAG
ncbi:MAG TPA: arsenate reductase, partial [Patescibacteria group bacterium]|nr:arsenate reductase [Patescibacteria group bacterium]